MNRFVTSRLAPSHRATLERIFFFHPEQSVFREVLVNHIGNYGSPQIVEVDNLLTINVPSLPGAQTLYAIERLDTGDKLLGVMVIHRTNRFLLEMHHIAIDPEITHWSKQGDFSVAALLIDELCRIGRRVQGIEKVRLAYRRGEITL
ncbi:MAG: hypothetical protein H7Y36_03215 [Armatimonadetes bacterium]|nr:hypothetical protein [Akkermansiaceae bacterium]